MLTSQTPVRADSASSTPEILGEVRWYNETAQLLGEISVCVPSCTVGSSPNCVVSIPNAGLAEVHATLVFGKRFILLKAPHTTTLAGRQVRELLLDRTTLLQVGNILLEVIPKTELGQSRSTPRVIRSNELAGHANALSFGDTQNTLDKQTEARFEALESTLGQLQSTIVDIQVQSQTLPEPEPADLAAQFAALSKSLADDIEQRLASRLDSQAQAVDQLRAESIEPIEETLEGLLVKLNDLAAQSERTTDQLANFVASAESQLSDLFSWREQLETIAQQIPPADPAPYYDWRQSNDSDGPAYDPSNQYSEPEIASPYEQQFEEPQVADKAIEGQSVVEQQLEELHCEPQPLTGQAYFLNAPPLEDLDSSQSPSLDDSSENAFVDESIEGINDKAYNDEYSQLSSSPLAAYLKQPPTEHPNYAYDEAESVSDEPEFTSNDPLEYSEQQIHEEPALDSEPFRYSPSSYDELSDSIGDSDDHDLPSSENRDLADRVRQMLAKIQTEEKQLDSDEEAGLSVEHEDYEENPESQPSESDGLSFMKTSGQDEAAIELEPASDLLDRDEESLPSAFELDRTSILDTLPELPSFDWNQDSLVKTQESETFEQPTPQVLAEGVSSVSSRDSEREESIEEYMQKLLQRVKQGPDGADNPASPLDELTVKSAPRSRSEFMNRVAKSAPAGQPPIDSESAEEDPQSETNRRGPTAQVDMNALRELANSNARRAIARSETKRASTTILVKVAVTSFAIAAASLILLLNGFQPNPPFAGFVAAVVIALIWGMDCYKHYRSLRKANPQVQTRQHNQVEEQNAVRLDENAENGWRPTPV